MANNPTEVTPDLSANLLRLSRKLEKSRPDKAAEVEKLIELTQARYDYNPPAAMVGAQWLYWGADNLLPTKAITIINGNSVSRQALDKISQYIAADGFKNEDNNLARTSIAAPQGHEHYVSILSLMGELAQQIAFWDGSFALLVRRTDNGSVGAVECIEPGDLRKYRPLNPGDAPNMFMYMPGSINTSDMYRGRVDLPKYYGLKVNADWTIAEKQRQMAAYGKYYGEVLFHFKPMVGIEHYPIPKWYSSSEWIQGDSALNRAFQFTAAAAFVPPTYLLLPDKEPEEKRNFEAGIRAQITGEQSRSINVIYYKDPNNKPEVIQTNNSSQNNTIADAGEKSAMQVCRLHGIDPALCGYSISGQLGNMQQLSIAEGMLNGLARGYRDSIIEVIAPLMQEIAGMTDWQWVERRSYVNIESAMLEVMTADEKRESLGLPPLPAKTSSIVDALNSMTPPVATKILEFLSQEQVLGLVGIKPDLEVPPIIPGSTPPPIPTPAT